MLIFLKLGGSLITDKSQPETPRLDVIDRLASELSSALRQRTNLRLIIGHGSGSFGHVMAKKYSTHLGVSSAEEWRGFAKVALSAARLNYLVAEALDKAGVPVFRIQPSASALCEGGSMREMAIRPIEHSLSNGLVPLVYGDVAVDTVQGGAIMSTEDVFTYLALALKPDRMLLIGDYAGVLDSSGTVINEITTASFEQVNMALGGSQHTDVTGGMASKVSTMLALCAAVPNLSVNIFAGDEPLTLERALLDDQYAIGTRISAPSH